MVPAINWQLVRLFLGGVELFDKSRGGDETRHKYLTHSEWHTDSKFVGLLKSGLPKAQKLAAILAEASVGGFFCTDHIVRGSSFPLSPPFPSATAALHMRMS